MAEGHEEVVLGAIELRRTYDLRISLLPTRHGRPVGWLLVLRDVTEERLLEKMREDLTHAMVHDLRNPLTAINAALHLLDVSLHENFTPSQEQMIHAARNSTQRMLALVSAIMDITQLESGQMPLEKVKTPLDELVTAVLDEQAPLATERGLRLENGIPSDIPSAWADTRLVGRVLQNLVGNAVKFTPRGGLVRVTARVDTSSPHIVVLVSDTGPGIPAEVIDRLFLKFVSGRQEGRGRKRSRPDRISRVNPALATGCRHDEHALPARAPRDAGRERHGGAPGILHRAAPPGPDRRIHGRTDG
jgi:signal transduction histidine kinase